MAKKWFVAALAAFVLGIAGKAQAATSDALTISITPNATYAVDIDTAAVTLTFAAAALDTDFNVVAPSTVTIQSTLATTDLRLDTTITSAGTAWSLGTTNALDTLQLWTLFTNTSVTTIPAKAGDNFDDTNDRVNAASIQVGDTVAFEDGSFDTDSQSPSTASHMWFRFHTPATTTGNDVQNVKLTLTAEAP